MKKIICRVLTGPTASGKSVLAFRLAAELGWEIICMDSMQIYRRMNIGTAKPTPSEQEAVPHHMLDICDPDETYSVSRYVEDALKAVRSCSAAGKKVLFVGGTGLYLESLVKGMQLGFSPADESLRAELNAISDLPDGKMILDQRLKTCDPETARKLPLNDVRRRIRAIEVSEITGIPFSSQVHYSSKESDFHWIIASTQTDRDVLYNQINIRVEQMIRDGLPGEVNSLIQDGISPDAQSMQAIGYKEMIPFLRGEWSLEKASDEIKKGTRHYAKRQMTYLKRIESIRYFQINSGTAFEDIRKYFTETGDNEHV